MKNLWRKLGLLYCPSDSHRHPKLLTHAANPLPVHVEGDVFRVFFNGRDASQRSSVGGVDIDVVRRQVVQEHQAPFFEHGPRHCFFENGVSIGNCYEAGGKRYIPFMGWRAPEGEHWRGEIGRLVVGADLSLALDDGLPLLGCDATDPLSLSYPWVMKDPSGHYAMWYGSTITWAAENGEMLHVLNHASSTDGHRWKRAGLAVPYVLGTAQAFSRPTVIGDPERGFEMWFSYRGGPGTKYRIGYARSADALHWALALDEAGIDVSEDGWDSEMVEYPFVFDHGGQRYMLYNGNRFGKTGFGLAVLAHA